MPAVGDDAAAVQRDQGQDKSRIKRIHDLA